MHFVAPRFFETLGFPLLRGRAVAWADREAAPHVVVVNETLARQLYPGLDPVGRTLVMEDVPVTVVGIAGDTKFSSLRASVRPTVYIPFRQQPQRSMTFALVVSGFAALALALAAVGIYGTSSRDPGALAGACLALLASALLAVALPARRATRIAPMQALRQD